MSKEKKKKKKTCFKTVEFVACPLEWCQRERCEKDEKGKRESIFRAMVGVRENGVKRRGQDI